MIPKEIKFHLLRLLDSKEAPLGAGGASDALEREDIHVSEATAGRLLKSLEREGLAVKVGGRGRALSPQGKAQLRALLLEREQDLSTRKFLSALRPADSREIVEVLVARRAIEAECAKLAARNGNPSEVEELQVIVAEMTRKIRAGENLGQLDERFHGLLARMSRNRILQSVLEVIRHNGRHSPILQAIRRRAGRLSGEDHNKLLQAVVERDEAGAGAAMTRHINNVLEDVERYFAEKGQP